MLSALGLAACGEAELTILRIETVDAQTGQPTPARLEVRASDGEALVASDALRVTLECEVAPPPDWAVWMVQSDRVENPHTGTTQFYSTGTASLVLLPGRYHVRAFKGLEFRVASVEVEVVAGAQDIQKIQLERWADPAAEHWFGADDHLHITRRTPEDDVRIGRWMAAEGLHIANLLQMGTAAQFNVTPQHDFGRAGEHLEEDTRLFSGQEHPRTHLLGHTITLGADEPIDLRETYMLYDGFWRASRSLGGVSGYAHWGSGPAGDGLAIDGPEQLVDFIEVLQFEFLDTEAWYGMLDLGIRLAPTAGTDFPCGPWSLPGRERFYTRVDQELSRRAWLAGIELGRTFVTNGPLLDFRVDDAEIGDRIGLAAPGDVRVTGRIRFDPERDLVRSVELIHNSRAMLVPVTPAGPGELRFDFSHRIEEGAWLALRVMGEKLDEVPLTAMPIPDWAIAIAARVASGASIDARRAHAKTIPPRPSAAHTAPIYVSVAGSVELGFQKGAAGRAREWIRRLEDLESRLGDDRIDSVPIWDWVPYSDGLSLEHLKAHRAALIERIHRSRDWYARRATGP